MVVNDTIHTKLDTIAEIYIHNIKYFTVYRRYNSVYEIVIKYINNDIYVRKDSTIRQALQDVLCLSGKELWNMYTDQAYSYGHNAPIISLIDLVDSHWTEIQEQYSTIRMNVGGILQDFQRVYDQMNTPKKDELTTFSWSRVPTKEEKLRNASPFSFTWESQVKKEEKKATFVEESEKKEDVPTNVVVQLSTEKEPWSLLIPKREWICYCDYELRDEEEEEEEDDKNYIVLRNGKRIRKRI